MTPRQPTAAITQRGVQSARHGLHKGGRLCGLQGFMQRSVGHRVQLPKGDVGPNRIAEEHNALRYQAELSTIIIELKIRDWLIIQCDAADTWRVKTTQQVHEAALTGP